jgi:hypothetical protein
MSLPEALADENDTLPPPVDCNIRGEPNGPPMSEWISREQFWKDQRDDHAWGFDFSSWTTQELILWTVNPEAWFAKFEPRWKHTYEKHLAWLNGLDSLHHP